jgi:hypothetical protein
MPLEVVTVTRIDPRAHHHVGHGAVGKEDKPIVGSPTTLCHARSVCPEQTRRSRRSKRQGWWPSCWDRSRRLAIPQSSNPYRECKSHYVLSMQVSFCSKIMIAWRLSLPDSLRDQTSRTKFYYTGKFHPHDPRF